MKTLKISALIFSLLVCLLLTCCNNGSGKDSDSPFDGSIMYAPPGLNNDRTDHVREPSTSVTGTEDTEDITETTAKVEDTTRPPLISDTDISDTTDAVTDTEPIPDTEPVPDTTEPADETTGIEERPPVVIDPETGTIDMRETLAPGFPVSGRFISAENPRLALAVNYECTMSPDGEVTVSLDVGLLAHAIHCGGRPSKMGELTIDGTTYNFATEAIANDNPGQIYVPFISKTYTVEAYKSSTTVSASWMFNGNYGGDTIKALTAAARFIW